MLQLTDGSISRGHKVLGHIIIRAIVVGSLLLKQY